MIVMEECLFEVFPFKSLIRYSEVHSSPLLLKALSDSQGSTIQKTERNDLD
jgi:hypothetical protein